MTIMRPEGLFQMKNFSDIIGNRTRDLPSCRAVPQPTALPRDPPEHKYTIKFTNVNVLKRLDSVKQLKSNNGPTVSILNL
jgi:hypothetical protein